MLQSMRLKTIEPMPAMPPARQPTPAMRQPAAPKTRKAATVPDSAAAYQAPAQQGEQLSPSQKWTPESRIAPGLLGEIAAYSMDSCTRARASSAVAAGLATVAAIAARAYRVAGAPLHTYIALPGDKGEAAETVGRLIAALAPFAPGIEHLVGPTQVGSTVAVIRHLDRVPAFVSHWRDGLAVLRSSADGSREELRTLLCDVWRTPLLAASPMPSAPLTRPVRDPALTLIATGSEEDLLAAQSAPDRLAQRFSALRSPPAALNQQPETAPPPELIGKLAELHRVSQQLQAALTHISVQIEPQAQAAFAAMPDAAFAVEKAHRIAGLAAVALDAYAPTINPELAAWAIQIVQEDARIIAEATASPDPAETLTAQRAHQRARVLDRMQHFVTQPWSFVSRNGLLPAVHKAKIVPLQYLSSQLVAQTGFSSDPAGATTALKRAINELIAEGALEEVPTSAMKSRFGRSARAFVFVSDVRL